MLTVHSISKTYGINTVLNNVSFNLNQGEKTGLIGPNGCGKTTLLRILTGSELADGGSYRYDPPSLRIGYLPQGADLPADLSMQQYLAHMQGDLPGLTKRLEQLAGEITASRQSSRLQEEYDLTLARIARVSEATGQTPRLLAAFGLDAIPTNLPVTYLSGGQKTRLLLAGLLLTDPQLLLLDEPTNHLDRTMLEWLEDWLVQSPCSILLVTHDRLFLDRVASTILELNPVTHTVKSYAGNYSDYLEQKLAERHKQEQEYADQQDEIARLKASAHRIHSIATFRKGGKADTGDKFAKAFFANRSIRTTRRAKAIEARIDRLLNEDHIDKPRDSWRMKMELSGNAETARDVVILKDLSIGYNGVPILKALNAVLRFGQRAVLSGPNGCGKTTLLRTITSNLPALSGTCRLGSGVRAGYMTQEQEDLRPGENALTTLQRYCPLAETEARAFLHKYLFSGDEVFTPAANMSFGQRSRLTLACLVVQGFNLLILDEPLNHLDLPSRNQFEKALSGFEGTTLTVTHDRYFIQSYATHLWEIEDGSMRIEELSRN